MPSIFSSPPKPKQQEPVPTPTAAPTQEPATEVKNKFRRAGRSQTVLTSPTGVSQPGPVAYKTALGQ